jgi:hypothetical protein
MIKPTSTYKMPKSIKMLLTRYKDPHVRGEMKRMMIQADLESKIVPKTDKNKYNRADE